MESTFPSSFKDVQAFPTEVHLTGLALHLGAALRAFNTGAAFRTVLDSIIALPLSQRRLFFLDSCLVLLACVPGMIFRCTDEAYGSFTEVTDEMLCCVVRVSLLQDYYLCDVVSIEVLSCDSCHFYLAVLGLSKNLGTVWC